MSTSRWLLEILSTLRRAGYKFNHKRVYRVCCQWGLNQRRRAKRVPPK